MRAESRKNNPRKCSFLQENKPPIAQFQVRRSLRSCGGGIPEEGTERSQPPALNFRRPKSRKRLKRAGGRPVEERAAGWSLLEGHRSVPFPPEHYFKEQSTHIKGNSEGRRRGDFGNLPSIQEFSAQIKLLLRCLFGFFIQKRGRKPRIIHSVPRATRPHTVRSGLSRLWGEKCTEEGGKKSGRLFSLLLSPPYGSRLPCSSAAPSCRRLQHRLSRQAGAAAHFKVRNRLPGPDSRIKTIEALCAWEKKRKTKRRRFQDVSRRLLIIQIPLLFFTLSNQATFSHVSPISPLLSKLQRHSEDLIKAERSRANSPRLRSVRSN